MSKMNRWPVISATAINKVFLLGGGCVEMSRPAYILLGKANENFGFMVQVRHNQHPQSVPGSHKYRNFSFAIISVTD